MTLLSWAVTRFARGVDRMFASAALSPPKLLRRRSSTESLGYADRLRSLSAVAAFYNRADHIALDGPFFPRPEPIEPTLKRVRRLGDRGEVIDLSWHSEFTPLWTTEAVTAHFGTKTTEELEAPGMGSTFAGDFSALPRIDASGELRDKYLRVEANRSGHARWYRHLGATPRPAVVILHGYLVGEYAIEERLWPVRKLFDSGVDVLLSVLPFHGLRRSPARGYLPPSFPSSDPRFTIEGMRQLVFDHRALFGYLTAQGTPAIGVMGVSLGGYGASLLCTVEERIRCALFFIPISSFEQFAQTSGRFIGTAREQAEQYEALRLAHFPISPLARAPLIRGDKVIVIHGDADVITGREHADPLAAHFEAQLQNFAGGHLLHFGRGRAFRAMWRMLAREGFLHPRACAAKKPS